MKASKVLVTLVLLGAILSTASISYAVSNKLYVQGRLTNAAGAYLPNGTYPVTFSIYKTETGGTPLWSDTFTEIKVLTGGQFSVTLGSQKVLTSTVLLPIKPILPERVSVFTPEDRWLEVVVDGEVFGPRAKINTSGYAANADTLDGLTSTNFSRSTHTHSLDKLSGAVLDTQIPAGIARDSELAAGLTTKANVVHSHDDRYYTEAEVNALLSAQATRITALETKVNQLSALLQGVSRNANDITFSGVNVRIVNGMGGTETKNGLGNLIVGYNELRGSGDVRTGSHNLVGGSRNNYSSYGGLVVGNLNTISGGYASVSGGRASTASGTYASVSGGTVNTAGAFAGSVSGGSFNTASSPFASVSGGSYNTASSSNASVSGGYNNKATTASYASVSGGADNTAGGIAGSVSGGRANTASGDYASVGGGRVNTASGGYASVGAGFTNKASGSYASVSGGETNLANAWIASVSGGRENKASSYWASVSGGYQNSAINGDCASVSGGSGNQASGTYASVSGGCLSTAAGTYASVSGGYYNTASGNDASVSGGYGNTASGLDASVSGGDTNIASAQAATVSGGAGRSASGDFDWAAGGLWENY